MLPQIAGRHQMAHSQKPPSRSPAKRSAKAMACIEARGLRKAFGTTVAVDGIDLRVEEGRILGIIGPNGAGKTTALNAILGLTPFEGELKVLGRDPWASREQLMLDACFISDVAVLRGGFAFPKRSTTLPECIRDLIARRRKRFLPRRRS